MRVDLDPDVLADAVGERAFARGAEYARQGAVRQAVWNKKTGALVGIVHGGRGNVYTTTASFAIDADAVHYFDWGECSCPVGFNCKHVAALVLSALDGKPVPGKQERREDRPAAVPVSWERSLSSLLDTGQDDHGVAAGAMPLAVELSLSGSQPRLSLVARLVRPGRNGWVAGGLSWTKLRELHYYGDYDAAHARLLEELYALSLPDADRYGHGYGYYGEQRTLDLSAFGSRHLWPLLDEAARIGLRLVHARRGMGDVAVDGRAELCLDVTSAADSLVVEPVVRVDGAVDGTMADAVPLTFIGQQGHGIVYVDRADASRGTDPGGWAFRLARLATPAPPALQRLALEGQRVEVPAADRPRFRDEYYPRLRRLAAVTSSDESFTPPEISGPTLVLRASYGEDHALELSWEWAYQIGDTRQRAPLGSSADGYRDVDAEHRVVAGLDAGLERFGLLGLRDGRRRLAPRVSLRGIDTMRFSTEVLPLLAAQPDVEVEISGAPADYHEAGDSLRIGVSTDEVAGETDWFDLGVTITVEGRTVPFADVFVALSRNEPYLLLPDGAYFSLEKPELQALRRLIEEARALQDKPTGPLRISRFQAGLWDELAELGVVERQAAAWQRQVDGLRGVAAVEQRQPPDTLSARLRPYQLDGFRWLAFLWENRLGGILADDMGLGKTVQSLALICHAKQTHPGMAPFLILAPTSVVANWAAEAARFAPNLSVVAVSDTARRRGESLDATTADADVVVTSYTLFRLDFDAYSAREWSGLLLDEAQMVKNHQAKAYQCVRRLPAPFKLALTGTPMENNVMELWSLLSVTAPGLFPSPTRFRDYYARPIERGDGELLAQLRRRIKPLVRRRTKEQVTADLPAKQEQVLTVELHPRHQTIYRRYLQRERQRVLGLLHDLDRNRFTILRSLTLLRQLSLDAGLVGDDHRDVPSSKVEALVGQLRDVIDGGHRALVFSQFTGFLDVVRRRLDAERVEYCYLDGKTRDRATVIERFKSGSAPVFLISLKAGGFGLNLTEADYCFLLDPWWNPATEAQAVDRTHRIGQTRNVMVYRLIAKDTIEEKVMALKARKAELFSSVMDDGNVFGASLDVEDIRGLLA